MDRYIVDLLLNEDNSPFNSKNFKLLIHKEYDSVRVDGEWFRMDNNDICHIIKKYGFICVE